MIVEFLFPNRFLYLIPLIIILIFLTWKDLVKLTERDAERNKELVKRRRKYKIIIFISRSLISALLVAALATPFVDVREKLSGDKTLTILVDNSASMDIYDKTVIDTLKNELEKEIPVKIAHIASGSRSNIGDGILANLGQDKNILLFSDGNNNFGTQLGDVALFAAELNATINALEIEPRENDLSVTIEGPSKVLTESENEFKVIVNSPLPLDRYRLTVSVNDVIIIDEEREESITTFNQIFEDGDYKIEARIYVNDFFSENNVFYKTVHAIKKPKILLLTEKTSSFFTVLDKLYDTKRVSTIKNENLEEYYAVVLNDMSASGFEVSDIDKLSDFLDNGNGLVVVGGDRSFEYGKYKDSLLSTLLPVTIGAGEKEARADLNSVILIDISPGETYTKLTTIKTIAHNLIDTGYRINDNVAVIAFSEKFHVVSGMSKITNKNVEEVKDKILRLQNVPCTGLTLILCSNIAGALEGATEILKGVSGEKQVVILSDMIFGLGPQYASFIGSNLQKEGIKVYPVAVFDLDSGYKALFYNNKAEIFMVRLADETGGIATPPHQTGNINIKIGLQPSQEEEDTGNRGLVILNPYHFITNNLETTARISGFNQVVPRSNSRLLVTTTQGEPILTVGRFGLGRVAVLSTDDGSVWAGQILNKANSKLITRMLNWAIGNPERKQEYYIRIDDTRVNKSTDVIVKSTKLPKSEIMSFYKTGKELYVSRIDNAELGFNEILGTVYAVNYDVELENLGLSPELLNVVTSSEGKIFKIEDTKGIVEQVITKSERFDIIKKRLSWPLILAALIIFLVEVAARRIKENKENG